MTTIDEFCDPMVILEHGVPVVHGLDGRPFLVSLDLLANAPTMWDAEAQVLTMGDASCRCTGRVRRDALIFKRVDA